MNKKKELVESVQEFKARKQDALSTSLNSQTVTAPFMTKAMTSLFTNDPDTNKMKEDISNLESQVVVLKADVTEVKSGIAAILELLKLPATPTDQSK
jgi:hypothetical protein